MTITKTRFSTAFWSILLLGASILLSMPHRSVAQTPTAVVTFRSLINEDKKELGDESMRLHLDLFEDPNFAVPVKIENIVVEGATVEGHNHLSNLVLDVTDPEGDVKVTIYKQKLGNVALSVAHLVAVDITQCPDLVKAEFTVNKLKEIDLSQNTELEYLNLAVNELSSLDLSHNPKLTLVECGFNKGITSLDLSNNLQLQTLFTADNKGLTSLDLSKHVALEALVCPNCSLTELKLAPTGKLNELKIFGNKLDREAIRTIAMDIPDRSAETKGQLGIINSQDPNEGNICWKEDVDAIKAKNWFVVDVNGDGFDPKEYTANKTVEGLSTIRVYPNPTSEVVHVVSATPQAVVQIYTSTGEVVYKGMTAEDGSCKIDLGHFTPGVYLVSVEGAIQTPLVVR